MASLETLPWLALSRICQYLDGDDDDNPANRGRSDLWAFSLTSRQCCAVASSQRFCQVRLAVASPEHLVRVLNQWVEVLDRDGGRHCYVRRLKIIPPGQDRVDDWWDENASAPSLSDIPRFCRPSIRSAQQSGAPELESATGETWLALARFIGRLPALKDLVWGFRTMPRAILMAIHAASTCRLHMHCFHLDSLVLHRDGYHKAINIDPDEYAVATSPALYSIVAEERNYGTDAQRNHNKDDFLGMVVGTAPNLQHVWFMATLTRNSLALQRAVAFGRPPAPPNNFFSPKVQRGKLRSLFFATWVFYDISAWATRTDFSKLGSLALSCYTTYANTLADFAARGDLTSLNGLCLNNIYAEDAGAVRRLLIALNSHSLNSLRLDGHVDDALFDTTLNRHGKSLQQLSLRPYPNYFVHGNDDDQPPPPPVVLTLDLFAQLREKCPNLEDVQLPVDRTLGDARECAVYRALGRLPRLRRLSLRLQYSVLPNEDAFDENGEFYNTPEEIPRAHLSQAFANAAVDADLARAIFDLISSARGGGLQHLQLLPERKAGRYAPGTDDELFRQLLRWFGRSWICERRNVGPDGPAMEIHELYSLDTVEAGTQWQYLAGKSRHYDGEEIYGEAFGDVWPQTIPRWWEDWRSIPLSPDDSRAVPPS